MLKSAFQAVTVTFSSWLTVCCSCGQIQQHTLYLMWYQHW